MTKILQLNRPFIIHAKINYQRVQEAQVYIFPPVVDCVWEPWSEWTACNVTCNEGTRWRTREKNPEKYDGNPCLGETLEAESCFPKHCPSMMNIMQTHTNSLQR